MYNRRVLTRPRAEVSVESCPWLHVNPHMAYGGALWRDPDVGVYTVPPMLRGS